MLEVSREQADSALSQLGYQAKNEEGGLVYYTDETSSIPLLFDFSKGPIPWTDFKRTLEAEGVNSEAFWAFIESM